MNNHETPHVLVALRRMKDNNDGKKMSIRHIESDIDKDIQILESKIKVMNNSGGIWRIYRSINKRNTIKAQKELIHFLIDNPERTNIESIWKTILMQPRNKAEKHFLIDIDDNDVNNFEHVKTVLNDLDVKQIFTSKTPNGFHIITPGFDTRGFIENFNFKVEIKKDALCFLKQITI